MKKIVSMILTAALAAAALPSLSIHAAGEISGTVTVCESELIRKADPELLGVGSEWGDSNSAMMESIESTEFSQEYTAAAKTIHRIPLARTAGASMNSYFWKNSIGPFETRKTPGVPGTWYFTRKSNFGPVEWIKTSREIDSECRFVVGINIYTESPELNAEYAEFLTGDSERSELAALRVQCGITEPVNVFAYELGNEIDGTLSAEEYCERAEKAIRAIRAKDPNARFIACGKTYPAAYTPKDETWRSWHKTILRRIGDEIDYISYHSYYDGIAVKYQEQYLDMISKDIKDITGSDRIKTVVTEQAKWDETGDNISDTNTLNGCLATADFLNRMYNRTDIAGANYYAYPGTLNGQWGFMGKGENEETWYLSGIGKLYNEYADRLGEYVLKSGLSMSDKTLNEKVSVLAMTGGQEELRLVIANKITDSDVSLSFDFEYDYTLTSESVFTADTPSARILGKDTKDAIYTVTSSKNEPGFTSYTLPAKSVVFLTLKRDATQQRNDVRFAVSDNMESYEQGSEFITGGGGVLGSWTASNVYSGWKNSFRMKAETDDGNKVLMAMGGANPSCDACINYNADRTNLSSRHTVSADFKQTHWSFNIGLRTMVHDNESSYYELSLKPDYAYAVFRKVNAGNVEYERIIHAPQKRGPGYNTVKLAMNGNEIYYSVKTDDGKNWISGVYYDSVPFELAGNEAGVALNVAGDQGYVYADNFSITDYCAETVYDFSRRSGKVSEYINNIRQYAVEYDNALSAESAETVAEVLNRIAEPLLEYDSHIIEDMPDDTLIRLAQKLITRGTIGASEGFTVEKADNLKKMITEEAELSLAEDSSCPADIQNVLEALKAKLRINLNNESYVADSQAVCTALLGRVFENTDQFCTEYKKQCALVYLKSNPAPEELCKKITQWDFMGYNTSIWQSVPDKLTLAQQLINAAEGFSDIRQAAEFIDSYIPTADALKAPLFTEDFESYSLMSEPLYGKGKTVGVWKSSDIFAGYESQNAMQIIADPQNDANKVLKLRGWGIDYPSCVDLTADLSTLDGGHTITADVYRVGNDDYRFGIRMMVNGYELDYYQLLFPGYNGKPLLQKVSDGTVVSKSTMSGAISGDNWYTVNMTFASGSVSCQIQSADGVVVSTGAFTDKTPFGCRAGDAKIQLVAQGDAGECYFDNISISRTAGDMVTDTTENALLADVMRDASIITVRNAKTDTGYMCDGDANTVYKASSSYFLADMGGEYPLSVLKFEGLSITGNLTVTASADYNAANWSQIAVITPASVTDGTVSVFLSDQKTPYRYLKINSSKAYQIGEIHALSRLDGNITDWRCSEPLYLSTLRDCADISVSGAATRIQDKTLIPEEEGQARISVVQNDGTMLNAYVNVTSACEARETADSVIFRVGIEKQCEGAEFIAAFYDADGKFLSAKTPSNSAKNSNLRTAELTAPLDGNCAYYKLMYWNMKDGGMQPLSDAYRFSHGG